MLFQVPEAEVTTVLAVPIPAHPGTSFDEAQLKDLVAHSFSMTLEEKREALGKIGVLSQHAINELIRILTEEQAKFAELNTKHEEQLRAAGEKPAS